MNTPIDDFSMPTDLDAVADRLREITPEAQFRYEATHSSKCFCSMKHDTLDTKSITQRRSTIKSSDYWKHEAIHYKTIFANVIFDGLLKQCTADGADNTNSTNSANSIDWQRVTQLYKRRFARQGLDAEDLEKHRRTIETEEYWEHEEECLKHFARIDQENHYARLWRKLNLPETEGQSHKDQQRSSRGIRRRRRGKKTVIPDGGAERRRQLHQAFYVVVYGCHRILQLLPAPSSA
ncbi:hypothetical protein HC256_010528 [Beauveria bassiana]|nr:hypothetical protein HC256_010528 [Beauveria bassiana]